MYRGRRRGSWGWVAGLVAGLGVAGCLRDLPDIPAAPEGGLITGRVVVRDPATTELVGLAGASAHVIGTGTFARTDERGHFEIAGAPLGDLRVSILRPYQAGGSRAGRLLSDVKILAGGQSLDVGDVELIGSGDIDGVVRVEGAASAGPGALIIAAQTGYKAVAGLDRAFSLTSLPEGTFDVVGFLPSASPATRGAITVTANAAVRLRELVFAQAGAAEVAVTGVVTLTDAADASGVTVRFDGEVAPSQSFTAEPTADGHFAVNLPLGPYRASFTRPGYAEVRLFGVAVTPAGPVGMVPVYLSPLTPGDLDGDEIPDEVDIDTDNDGCDNAQDGFPRDPYACADSDGDGVDDDIDDDDDDDTLTDAEETSLGLDGWLTNPLLDDTDADGPTDPDDNCPTVTNADQADADNDRRGDACSTVTSTQTPPTPTAAVEAFPSVVLAGDVVRFTGAPVVGATAVRVGNLALEAVTATTGGVLATVPTGIAPGEAIFSVGGREVAGPRLSVLVVRELPTVTCPTGGILALFVDGDRLFAICADVTREFRLSDGGHVADQPLGPARATQASTYDLATRATLSLGADANGNIALLVDGIDRQNSCTNLGPRSDLPVPNGMVLRVAHLDSMNYVQSPATGRWIDQSFCTAVAAPTTVGIVAMVARPANADIIVRHTDYGFASISRGGYVHSAFDGQRGTSHVLILENMGSVLGLGPVEGVMRFFPRTARPATQLARYAFLPLTTALLHPQERWLLTTEVNVPTTFAPEEAITSLFDLTTGRRVREWDRRDNDRFVVARSDGHGHLVVVESSSARSIAGRAVAYEILP